MLGDVNRAQFIQILLNNLLKKWKRNPQALEDVWLSLLSVDETHHCVEAS